MYPNHHSLNEHQRKKEDETEGMKMTGALEILASDSEHVNRSWHATTNGWPHDERGQHLHLEMAGLQLRQREMGMVGPAADCDDLHDCET